MTKSSDDTKLREAIQWAEKNYHLPRCEHGSALCGHSGERLAPPCGYRAPAVSKPSPECVKRLQAVIRRFTVEGPNGQPNGPTERAYGELCDALEARDLDAAQAALVLYSYLTADDIQGLREAAEDMWGGDFRAEVSDGHL